MSHQLCQFISEELAQPNARAMIRDTAGAKMCYTLSTRQSHNRHSSRTKQLRTEKLPVL